MSRYNIKLSILTPLSIGAGSEQDYVKGANYVEKDGKIYFLNMRKLVEKIDPNELCGYFERKDSAAIVRILGSNLDAVSDRVLDLPAETDNDVKAFIRNQFTDCPIIPGSSLKGAIRSHIYKMLSGSDMPGTDKATFGDMISGDNIMRFFKVSDFDFSDLSLTNTKIFNLESIDGQWSGAWKHGEKKTSRSFNKVGFNTIYEALQPGQNSCGAIITEPDLYSSVTHYNKDKGKGGDTQKELARAGVLSLNDLFKTINEHTRDYLLKEKEFFETFNQAEGSDSIIDSIDDLIHSIPKDNNSCILKMSAGSGYHSITGDWRFDDYSSGDLDRKPRSRDEAEKKRANEAKPKSRKIAIGDNGRFSLMGFVKLEIISEQEAASMSGTRDRLVESAFEKARKNALYIEEVARIEAETASKKAEYDSLIREAETAIDEKRYVEAKDALIKAQSYGLGDLHIALLERLSLLEGQFNDLRANELKVKADDLFKDGNYSDALHLYQQIQALESHVIVSTDIDNCQSRLALAQESIEQFAARLNIASPGAFAGNCKKRNASGQIITIDDVPYLAKRIRESIQGNSKLAKDWKDRRKYKPIEQVLGMPVTDAIYKSVTE